MDKSEIPDLKQVWQSQSQKYTVTVLALLLPYTHYTVVVCCIDYFILLLHSVLYFPRDLSKTVAKDMYFFHYSTDYRSVYV